MPGNKIETMSGTRELRSLVYADLRDDDVLIDKSGGRWHVSSVERVPSQGLGFHAVTFWLGDVRTKVRMHHMTKSAGDPVTVERIATHADDVAALNAGSTLPDPSTPRTAPGGGSATTSPATSPGPSTNGPGANVETSSTGVATSSDDPWQTERLEAEAKAQTSALAPELSLHDAAVASVEFIGGEVVAEQTAAEVDTVRRATEDDPVVLPLFESMTDLEQRSHLFVLHGIFADDVDDRKGRAETHVRAHSDRAQGKIKSRHTPHVHSENATVKP